MSTASAAPAWPRRPPMWSTLALLASFLLTVLYCRVEVAFMPGNEGKLLPTYINSAAWRYVPPIPSLHRRMGPPTHKFVLPDGSSLQIPATILYHDLRRVAYGGTSVLGIFQHAFICSGLTLVILLTCGMYFDRKHEEETRNGRRIRGPRVVSRWRFARFPAVDPVADPVRPVETGVDPDPGRTSLPTHKSAFAIRTPEGEARFGPHLKAVQGSPTHPGFGRYRRG